MNMNNFVPVSNCSSCGACVNICSKDAIVMKPDKDGFYRPVVDEKKCERCGLCIRICPWTKNVFNPNESFPIPKVYAAFAINEKIRLESSSGGVFSVLAESILQENGVVVGVAQLDKYRFGHLIVESKSELSRIRGSKYVQSNPNLIYRQIQLLLKGNRKVLFSGTPCQVAALYSFLGKKTFENLTTIDVVCHGVSSEKVFRKYVECVEHEENKGMKECAFRDKTTGWRHYSISCKFMDGTRKIIPHNLSQYMRLFLNRISQNVSCDDCRYRRLPRISDITLGDYWGIEKKHAEMNDDKGISVVLLNTCRGEQMFKKVADKLKICKSNIDDAIAGNPCIVRSEKRHAKRNDFFGELDYRSMDELIKKYCPNPSIMKKNYLRLKRFAKKYVFSAGFLHKILKKG